jgi:hypothetical protein
MVFNSKTDTEIYLAPIEGEMFKQYISGFVSGSLVYANGVFHATERNHLTRRSDTTSR